LSLAQTLATYAYGATDFTASLFDGAPRAAQAPTLLAWLTDEERDALRKQWQHIPPDERDRIRQKLRDKHLDPIEEGYGQGFEVRRRDSDPTPDLDNRPDPDRPQNWGKPRPADPPRGSGRGRR
jgi:hypothetical protein